MTEYKPYVIEANQAKNNGDIPNYTTIINRHNLIIINRNYKNIEGKLSKLFGRL